MSEQNLPKVPPATHQDLLKSQKGLGRCLDKLIELSEGQSSETIKEPVWKVPEKYKDVITLPDRDDPVWKEDPPWIKGPRPYHEVYSVDFGLPSFSVTIVEQDAPRLRAENARFKEALQWLMTTGLKNLSRIDDENLWNPKDRPMVRFIKEHTE